MAAEVPTIGAEVGRAVVHDPAAFQRREAPTSRAPVGSVAIPAGVVAAVAIPAGFVAAVAILTRPIPIPLGLIRLVVIGLIAPVLLRVEGLGPPEHALC